MIWQGKQANAFVEVVLPDQNQVLLPQDFLSLTVTEELERMPQGSLVLRDPNLMYSRLIPRGAQLTIAWGYTGGALADGGGLDRPDRLMRGLERRGLRVWVQNPSGSAADDGTATYRCNFVGLDFRGRDHDRNWSEGTKADVVHSIFDELGVREREVRFDRGSEVIREGYQVIQSETDFSFLARMGREWGAALAVGFDKNGEPLGAFVNHRDLKRSAVVAKMGGRRAAAVGFTYKVGREPNVLSYEWRHHEGDSGVGDSVSIEYVNGEAQFVRRTVEADKVVTWRLNQDRIDAELERRRSEGGLIGEAQLVQEVVSARSFEEVERFFDAVESETAPNGVGFTIDCKAFGDTTAVPGTQVEFGQGFPDMFSGGDNRRTLSGAIRAAADERATDFYIKKNIHSISNSGYFSQIEVVDAYAISPTGVALIGGGF